MASGQPPAAPISMSARHYQLLSTASRQRTLRLHHRERVCILLLACPQGGGQSNSFIRRQTGNSLNTVKVWRSRWQSAYCELVEWEQGTDGTGVSDTALLLKMLSLLDDAPRSGRTKTITLSQEQQIVALACRSPSDFGLERTTWTHQMLAHVALSEQIVSAISSRYIGTILKKNTASTA
jgi:hypothetical protein